MDCNINTNTAENQSKEIDNPNEFDDDYDEQYRNVICWNCETKMIAGKSWDKVQCPVCKEINLIPVEEIQVTEWERILEMQHVKVTCTICKKVIYAKRESEFVTCGNCNTIMTIVKEVPLRPATIVHPFSKTVAIPEENDFVRHGEILDWPQMSNYDKFKPWIETVRKNEFNIKYNHGNYDKKRYYFGSHYGYQ